MHGLHVPLDVRMDPISQGVLGASASQSAARRQQLVAAGICGLLAGLAPDLDSLIRSDTDPLLYLEYHRQFTHSLVFIPVGGLLCAVVLHRVFRRRLTFRQTWLYCTLGYATHGLLDACTTYGTQLLWPFSDLRVAWHAVSIIDPLFTGPIALLVVAAGWLKRRFLGRAALAWAVFYLAMGAVQRERAETAGAALAASRGHLPIRLEAKPSFGNIYVWKVIYEAAGYYHVDAVRVGLDRKVFAGESILKFDAARDLQWLDPQSQQARDIERFRWFSDGYLALDRERSDFIIDMRYSLIPNEVDALWGIQLDRNADAAAHVRFIWQRRLSAEKRVRFKDLLLN
jgi:inner membrane protein